jgi:hypothetical protein
LSASIARPERERKERPLALRATEGILMRGRVSTSEPASEIGMPRLRIVSRILLAVALVLASALTGLAEPDKDELKVAKEIIDKLVADPTVLADVEKLKKKTSNEAIMALLDTKGKKGGLGYGPKGAISIEKRIQDIAKDKKDISDAVLKDELDDLIKAVQYAKAVNEYSTLYKPEKAVAGKDPKVWVKTNEDSKKALADLLDALKAKDAKKVTAAAKAADLACVTCHNMFKGK